MKARAGAQGRWAVACPFVGAAACKRRLQLDAARRCATWRRLSTPGDGIAAQGYAERAWAESIAAGQGDTPSVLAAWLGSDGHCANLMNASLRDVALACVSAPGTRYTTYWTLKPGASR